MQVVYLRIKDILIFLYFVLMETDTKSDTCFKKTETTTLKHLSGKTFYYILVTYLHIIPTTFFVVSTTKLM